MPNSAESESDHGSIERLTGARYSLANPRIASEDFFITHMSGRIRLVSYPAPRSEGKRTIRDTLKGEGLVLGVPLFEKSHGKQVYRVPSSARPISYDSSSHAQGAFSYGDDRLFYDLGYLLGSAQSMGFVLDEEIGHSVALVEFSRPEEKQLFFIPGIECLMDFNMDGEDHLGHYTDSLRREFGGRFMDGDVFFRMGFSDAAVTEAGG